MSKELKTYEPKREMPLVNKIKDIHSLIAENYSDKEPLDDNQKKSRDVFYRYCKDIEKALEREEKLERAINICTKKRVDFYALLFSKNAKDYNYSIAFFRDELTEEEFNLLKEVFGN